MRKLLGLWGLDYLTCNRILLWDWFDRSLQAWFCGISIQIVLQCQDILIHRILLSKGTLKLERAREACMMEVKFSIELSTVSLSVSAAALQGRGAKFKSQVHMGVTRRNW